MSRKVCSCDVCVIARLIAKLGPRKLLDAIRDDSASSEIEPALPQGGGFDMPKLPVGF